MSPRVQTLVRIQANLQWSYLIGKGGNYVAKCDPLKLTLQAPTWAELMEDTSDVLDAIFRDLMKRNELDRFLREHGFSVIGEVSVPVDTRKADVRFDVPFFFVPEMARRDGSQRYVPQ